MAASVQQAAMVQSAVLSSAQPDPARLLTGITSAPQILSDDTDLLKFQMLEKLYDPAKVKQIFNIEPWLQKSVGIWANVATSDNGFKRKICSIFWKSFFNRDY